MRLPGIIAVLVGLSGNAEAALRRSPFPEGRWVRPGTVPTLRLDVRPESTDALGNILTGIFQQQVTLPVLGTLVLRPGQLLAAPEKPQREKLIQSGRLWEKLLNGYERWSAVYQSSIQLVKSLD